MTTTSPPLQWQEPKVVIADDQALVRTGFRLILAEAGIAVVAEAADGAEAVAVVLKLRAPTSELAVSLLTKPE